MVRVPEAGVRGGGEVYSDLRRCDKGNQHNRYHPILVVQVGGVEWGLYIGSSLTPGYLEATFAGSKFRTSAAGC